MHKKIVSKVFRTDFRKSLNRLNGNFFLTPTVHIPIPFPPTANPYLIIPFHSPAVAPGAAESRMTGSVVGVPGWSLVGSVETAVSGGPNRLEALSANKASCSSLNGDAILTTITSQLRTWSFFAGCFPTHGKALALGSGYYMWQAVHAPSPPSNYLAIAFWLHYVNYV